MPAQLNPRGDVAVIIPAAGSGVRLGPGAPKALRLLGGEPLLVHAVRRVAACPDVGVVIVAAPPDQVAEVRVLLAPIAPVTVVAGGTTRQQSVAAALATVPELFDIVLVHDAARALAPPALVAEVAAAIRAGHDAVIPVLPVIDTIKEVAASRPGADVIAAEVLGTVDRSVLRAVQTPQGFRRAVLVAAHAASAVDDASDDAGMVEKLGVPVACVPGSDHAIKITRPFDLAIAELLLNP